MAALVNLQSTMSAEELVLAAQSFAESEVQHKEMISASIQCLMALWSHLLPLASGTNVDDLSQDLTPCVERFREQFPTTTEINTLTSTLWVSVAYIHKTRNVCNLIPLITSDDTIRLLAKANRDYHAGNSAPPTDDEIKNTKAFCMIYAGVYIVADQLLVHPTTRERTEYLMGPILRLMLRSFIH